LERRKGKIISRKSYASSLGKKKRGPGSSSRRNGGEKQPLFLLSAQPDDEHEEKARKPASFRLRMSERKKEARGGVTPRPVHVEGGTPIFLFYVLGRKEEDADGLGASCPHSRRGKKGRFPAAHEKRKA